MNIIKKYTFPTNNEFNDLFYSVGWGHRDNNKIDYSRKHTTFAISIYDDSLIVGMARVVGDGTYYTVYDVVTRKEYQNRGIGTMLMQEVVAYYESIKDDDTYLYLGASKGREHFYERFGFKARPYKDIGAGMKYDID